MGTRINVLVDHQLPDYRDASMVVAALSPTIPLAYAVRDYWADSQSESHREDLTEWTVARKGPPPECDDYYLKGPGSLFIDFTDHVARIRTGGRWRGFLSIPELQRVHLNAFNAIAGTLGATTMVFYCDNDFVDEVALYDKQPLSACIAKLSELWGPAQESIHSISPEIVAATDHCPPTVWFVEAVGQEAT